MLRISTERSVEDIETALEQIQQLPLLSFDFFIEYNLEQKIVSTTLASSCPPVMGTLNQDGRGW